MSIENWLQLINISAVTLVGLIGIVTARKLKTISITLDGRLTQLLALNAKASHAEGVIQEKNEATAAKNLLP